MKQDTIMVFRMLFLWMVAAAVARGRGDRDPDFLTEHPEDPKKFVKDLEPASLWATQELLGEGPGLERLGVRPRTSGACSEETYQSAVFGAVSSGTSWSERFFYCFG